MAYIYAYRGEADNAFEWLGKELEYNGPGGFAEIVTENLFEDPRRRALAAVSAQGRQGVRATDEDRVQGDAAAMKPKD